MKVCKHFLKTIEERKNEVIKIKEKYPDKVFIYLRKNETSKIEEIDKHKYLCTKEMQLSQFIYIIRKRLNINDKESLLFFINNSLPPITNTMEQLYEKYKSNDDFLYIKYSNENVFG